MHTRINFPLFPDKFPLLTNQPIYFLTYEIGHIIIFSQVPAFVGLHNQFGYKWILRVGNLTRFCYHLEKVKFPERNFMCTKHSKTSWIKIYLFLPAQNTSNFPNVAKNRQNFTAHLPWRSLKIKRVFYLIVLFFFQIILSHLKKSWTQNFSKKLEKYFTIITLSSPIKKKLVP